MTIAAGAPRGMTVAATARRTAARLALLAALITLAAVAVGVAVTQLLVPSQIGDGEGALVDDLAANRTPTGETVSRALTFPADTITVVVLSVVVGLACRWAFGRWRETLFIALAVTGETLIFWGTTNVIDRERPDVPRLDIAPPTSSFPSGHTAAAVCFYGAVALITNARSRRVLLRALIWSLAIVIPLVVAGSRLYRGMHFPSDVIGGALLGFAWLLALSRSLPLGLDRDRAP